MRRHRVHPWLRGSRYLPREYLYRLSGFDEGQTLCSSRRASSRKCLQKTRCCFETFYLKFMILTSHLIWRFSPDGAPTSALVTTADTDYHFSSSSPVDCDGGAALHHGFPGRLVNGGIEGSEGDEVRVICRRWIVEAAAPLGNTSRCHRLEALGTFDVTVTRGCIDDNLCHPIKELDSFFT